MRDKIIVSHAVPRTSMRIGIGQSAKSGNYFVCRINRENAYSTISIHKTIEEARKAANIEWTLDRDAMLPA